MNRDEFEQKFEEGAKSVFAWTQAHTLAASVIVAFVSGFVVAKIFF